MDAWANISHYLDYKSDIEIPKELKKDFFALSGLFYVADTHFEIFFKNKKEQSKVARADVEKNIDIEINFETIEAYINNRFKKRKAATPEHISKITQELRQTGYEKISDLDIKLNEAFKIKPESLQLKTLNRAGIIRTILDEMKETTGYNSRFKKCGIFDWKVSPPILLLSKEKCVAPKPTLLKPTAVTSNHPTKQIHRI